MFSCKVLMSTFTRQFLLGAVVVFPFTLPFLSLPASAAGHIRCVAYAEGAMLQIKTATQNGCGFRGRGWIRRYEPHYDWCRGASESALRTESRNRAAAIEDCTTEREPNHEPY